MKVLVVDDSKVMRMKLKSIIASAGIPTTAILEAGHGREALTILETETVDVMFTDINMPEMDGRQLLRELSQRSFRTPLYRVVCTTETPQGLRDELTSYGVNVYIEKPFDSEAVKRLLSPLVASRA